MRADYETLAGGKDARGSRERIGESNVLSRLRQLGDPAVLPGRPARPSGDVPEEQRRVGGQGDVALQGRQLYAGSKGDEGAVRGLYERIAADPRHGGEITLQQGFAEGRQVPDWSVGLRDLDSPEAR
jgi:hypothetical protein